MTDFQHSVATCEPPRARDARRGCRILLYHRVCDVATDPLLLCVSRRHFAEQLDLLRREYNPISLRQLMSGIREKNVPDNSVVVTFDDGYRDNLQFAKPLLERFDIPATIFVTSGYVGGRREFWWDELDRLLLQRGDLPKSVRLSIGGSMFERFLGSDALEVSHSFERRRTWNVEREDLTGREELFRRLQMSLRPLADEHRRRLLGELLAWSGASPEPRDTHRAMSPEELNQIASGGLIEIGGHTVTHPVLSGLPLAAQRDEIVQGKTHLESILARPLESFSYPFGTRGDYTSATVRAVKRAGYRCACSNFPGLLGRRSDAFQLPRSIVRNWDGDAFARRLTEWSAA